MSGTGQYQTAISLPIEIEKYGYIFTSNDYGTSWFDVSYNITEDYSPFFLYSDISISYTGKYQTISISGIGIIISDDYGLTWKKITNTNDSVYCIINKSTDSMIDGKYQYYISDSGTKIFVSIDYGNTWNFYYIVPNSNKYFIFFSFSTSSDGKYVYCSTVSDYISSIIISNDYGHTWTFSYFNFAQYYSMVQRSFSNSVFQIDTSSNGMFVTLTNNDNKILFSNDYGKTFVDFNDSLLYNFIYPVKCSSSGQYQISLIPNDSIIISNNNGISWNKININNNWSSCSISLSGQYQCVIDKSSLVYISYDYGKTWTYNIQLNTGKIIKVSGDGKIYVVINTENIGTKYYISNDYGKIFIESDQIIYEPFNIGISLSGKYQTVLTFFSFMKSNDYGITFTPIIPSLDTFIIGSDNISMSSNGKFQLVTTNFQPFYFVTSDDYGEKWIVHEQSQSDIISVEDCTVSSTGQYQFISIYTNPNIYIYYSIDYGNSWSIMNTKSINYSCQLSSISTNGQSFILSNQNNIYQIYLNSL